MVSRTSRLLNTTGQPRSWSRRKASDKARPERSGTGPASVGCGIAITANPTKTRARNTAMTGDLNTRYRLARPEPPVDRSPS